MECLLCTLRAPRPSLTRHLPQAQHQRPASTARRLRVLHRVPPALSFTPGPEAKQAHIIYNPPSSLPNVYHTPTLFLPASDPRRPAVPPPTAATASTPLSATATLARTRAAGPHPSTLAALAPPRERTYHLSPADVAELRALRAADHRAWSVKRLAARFGCSEAFVRLCAYSVEAKAEEEERVGKIKARWGRTKREGREEREKRREGWGRGE